MELSLQMICERLPELQMKLYGSAQSDVFQRPTLYEAGMDLEPGQLYVLSADDLPQQLPAEGTAIICVGKNIPNQWKTAAVNLIQVCNGSGVTSVLNQVQALFSRVDQWENRLLLELSKEDDFDIKEFIRIGVELLENPINMMDPFTRLLFDSTLDQAEDGTLQITVQAHPHYITTAMADNMRKVCATERLIRVPFLSSVPVEHMEPARSYCFNLYPLGYYMGCAILQESFRPFYESDFLLADQFFQYFQRAYLKYWRKDEKFEPFQVKILQRIFLHRPLEPKDLEMLSLSEQEAWVFFSLRENPDMKSMPRDYMVSTINANFPDNAFSMLLGEKVVGLLRVTRNVPADADAAFAAFSDFVASMGFTGGFSNQMLDMRYCDDYILQADYAADCCAHAKGTIPYTTFPDYALSYILDTCGETLSAHSLQSVNLRMLQAYDQQKKCNYLETLRLYLEEAMNITRTAERLYIHRSSLLKRLSRITQLTGLDLNDPDTRLYCSIWFKLHRRK